jgi:two-component system, OmpR family, phosphate regulon sensor histidine kinase PhoR
VLKGFAGQVLVGYGIALVAGFSALVFAGASLVVVAVVTALLVLAGVFVFAAIGTVRRSAKLLGGAAREVADGQFAVRMEMGEDELGSAAAEFNRMATKLEQRVEAASQERNRLMAAINSSVDGVIAVDAENNVTFANAAVATLLGREPEELLGQPFVWVVSDSGVIQALRDSREESVRSSHEIERPRRTFLRAIVTPIRGGGAWSSLVVFHDLTDVKRVEQVRRDFVANVSHELRTPLAAIKSVIETLDGGAMDDREVAHEFLNRADAEVERLVQMVEELLELSRIESGELRLNLESVDISAVVSGAVDRLRPQAGRLGLDLRVEIPSQLPEVRGDRLSLERAVVNLVHNATKFTAEGGSILVAATEADGGVEVSVADTGAGIDAQDLPRIFERFYKADRARRAGGTGLGLAVVKHTIEAHGGRVEAESELGQGSVFRFWLPAVGTAPAAEAVSAVGELE